jgi:hypothetical protein
VVLGAGLAGAGAWGTSVRPLQADRTQATANAVACRSFVVM